MRKRALVQHDSTGNWLHLVLRELFAETVFIHHANCDFDFIDRLAPDLFLFIQVERFFVREPANSVDLPTLIAGYEAKRGAPRSAVPFLASPPAKPPDTSRPSARVPSFQRALSQKAGPTHMAELLSRQRERVPKRGHGHMR